MDGRVLHRHGRVAHEGVQIPDNIVDKTVVASAKGAALGRKKKAKPAMPETFCKEGFPPNRVLGMSE